MRFNLDSAFGVHQQALLLRSKRAEVLANNLANADTPGFQARDLDFKAILSGVTEAPESQSLVTTHNNHIAFENSDPTADMMYRLPLHASVDGNTVDAQIEKAEFVQNAMSFQASYTFLNGKIKTLMAAIRGE